MRNLYRKNELAFALVWIAAYVAGTCLAETLNEVLGVFKVFSALIHISLSIFALIWLKKNGLREKYGLFLPCYRLSRAWFFLPLAAVGLYKLCFSPAPRYSAADTVFFVVSMLCVGFLEELVFRGFLFRSLERENLAGAIVISSLTFGIGHIVNLLNGQSLSDTAWQVLFAVVVGFALVILFHKGGSLIPCIVFHGIFNALSAVSNDEAMYQALGGKKTAVLILSGACIILLGSWSLWNWKHLKHG